MVQCRSSECVIDVVGEIWRRNENGGCHGGKDGVVLRRLVRSCEVRQQTVTMPKMGKDVCCHAGRWLLTDVVVHEGSCLNLTTLDWTRPDDLKTQEEYQVCPDVPVLTGRNL
ncbi:hypothetical protein Bbelb_250970 [Branchiostoma belcheri]|nr:hypothetical protein Bbelb_250970 [Branchiostoma belcheri]